MVNTYVVLNTLFVFGYTSLDSFKQLINMFIMLTHTLT
jgi:hypothetical protein